MNAASLFLTPSAPQNRGAALLKPSSTSSSSTALMDVVPFEAALHRLLYEKVQRDEQLSSYGVQQAYRGLLYAVRAASLSLNGVGPARHVVDTSVTTRGGAAGCTNSTGANEEESGPETCVVRGWQAVLYRLALAAVRSADDVECAVFLSVRVLCDPASAHGEGNERPCCTAEWVHALLQGLPLDDASFSHDSRDTRFAHLVQTDHRYQLGYLMILSNTLRMVASGRVEGHCLCSDYPELFQGVAKDLLPRIAQCVEASMRDTEERNTASSADKGRDAAASLPPSRLSVEFNHALIHVGHWLTVDTLSVHMNAESGEDDESAESTRRSKKRPLVLDRDQPLCLWGCVTLVRNALRRMLTWLSNEVLQQLHAANGGARNTSRRSPSVALLREVSQQLESSFTDLLKKHEYLLNARFNVARAYDGVVTRDEHSLTEAAWAHTLQTCFLLRNLTGVWVSVHGGLSFHVLCADQLLPGYRDVLMLLASSLLRIPVLEKKREETREVFLAVDASLCALLALVSAAPTPAQQAELWASDTAVTQQVHALLMQRALRFRDDRVLRLASLLSRAILDAAVQNGALAGFATDSADQLLELLESDDDAATRCVGELLSVAVAQHPYRMVPALFRLLRHGSGATRRHVLEVLCSLPDLLGETTVLSPTSSASTDQEKGEVTVESEVMTLGSQRRGDTASSHAAERRREVLRLLAENLLLQLNDEELCVRMLSSSLFANVHPSDVLQPLLNLCVQRDATGRKQSAAAAALTSVLAAHTDNAVTFVMLLRTAYAYCRGGRGGLDEGGVGEAVSAGAAATSEATGQAGDGSVNVFVRRPVPQTPGDVLAQALLYSTGDNVTENDEDDGGCAGAAKREKGITDAARSGGARGRVAAHVSSVLLSLTDKWVHAALPKWSYARHSLPLVQCLAEQAFCRHTEDAGAASSSPRETKTREGDEDKVQFFMKYTLRVTSAVTGAVTASSSSSSSAEAGEDATVTPAELVAARAAHLLAIWHTFFGEAGSVANDTTCAERWKSVVESDTATLSKAPQGSAEAQARVHAALLPLLCLRSCAPGTFTVPSFGDMEELCGLSSSCGESLRATAALQQPALATAQAACDEISSAIWQTLWSAITRIEVTKDFFAFYPDIQRVVLEVLCRFPAGVFFTHWQQWKKRVITDDVSDSATLMTTSESLFLYRVYVFGVSAYVAASLSNECHPRGSRPPTQASASTDFSVALQHCDTLIHILTTFLPQWLMEDDSGASSRRSDAAAAAELEAAKQRLCVAALDAGGVLGVVELAYQHRPTAVDSVTMEVGLQRRELESTCEALLKAPLHNLTLAYRATAAENGSTNGTSNSNSNSTGAADASASAEPPWTALLTRFQLCLRLHASLLRAIAVYPRGAESLLLLWFRDYLRAFMELSNAACKSAVGRAAHACRAAVDACGTVFQAVLTARKLDDATVNVGSCTAATAGGTPSSPTLCRLAWEEKDALVSFSVGCTRFAASPAVQTVGVRLVSSILVTAPEIFVEVSTPHDGKSATTPSIASGGGEDALQAAAAALQSIALLHADRPTRLLAEEVLCTLEKACSTTSDTDS